MLAGSGHAPEEAQRFASFKHMASDPSLMPEEIRARIFSGSRQVQPDARYRDRMYVLHQNTPQYSSQYFNPSKTKKSKYNRIHEDDLNAVANKAETVNNVEDREFERLRLRIDVNTKNKVS